ncbi:hypothetical protein MMC16_005736 [Acarospora aff. strigata]|nr:hypothetical protein [Acarospora aff. strigata]
MTLSSETTIAAPAMTTLSSSSEAQTYGGVTTVVETATTIVCPYATVSPAGETFTSIIMTTTYVCPSSGTYTIAPTTTSVSEATVMVYPTPASFSPGTYTQPETTITITETSAVFVCPYTSSTPMTTVHAQTSSVPAPAAPVSSHVESSVSEAPTSHAETSAPAAPSSHVESSASEVPSSYVETAAPAAPTSHVESSAPAAPTSQVESTPAAPTSYVESSAPAAPTSQVESTPAAPTSYVESSAPAAPTSQVESTPAAPSAPATSSHEASSSSSQTSAEYVAPTSSIAISSAAPSSTTAASPIGGGNQWAMTYSPYTSSGECKGAEAVSVDVALIAGKGFSSIRIYSTDCNGLENVGHAAKQHNLKLVLGIYIAKTGISVAQAQISAITNWANGNWAMVEMIVVGNEAVFNHYVTMPELAGFISQAKSTFRAAGYTGPVTTTEPMGTLQENASALCGVIDVVAANIHPFFNDGVSAAKAGKFVATQLEDLEKVCPGLKTYNLETGWPHSGDANGKAVPGTEQQQLAIKAIMESAGGKSVFFSFVDDMWKQPGEHGVEQSWGCAHLFGN